MTNYDENPLKRADALSQAYARSMIKQALVSDEILVGIEIDWYGRIKIKTNVWEMYWADVIPYLSESDIELLQSLQLSRKVLSTSHCTEINRQGGENAAAVFCITGEKYKHALPGRLLK